MTTETRARDDAFERPIGRRRARTRVCGLERGATVRLLCARAKSKRGQRARDAIFSRASERASASARAGERTIARVEMSRSLDRAVDASESVANANERKVLLRWREVMRARKRRETRDAIEREARAHDDSLDDREREIAALDEAVDEGERAHRLEADAQTRRLEEARARSDAEAATMDARVEKELRKMRDAFEREDGEAHVAWREEVDRALKRGEEARAADARERDARRASFEGKREEIRNQHGEDVSTMKMIYEKKIRDLEQELARVTAPSVRLGDLRCGGDADEKVDVARAYEIIKARDEADARRLAKTLRSIKRIRSGVNHWREKTDRLSKEWRASQERLVAERSELELERRETASKLATTRASRERSLRDLCVSSETAIKELSQTLECARRVLRLHSRFSRRAADDPRDDVDDIDDIDDARDDDFRDYTNFVLSRYRAARERARGRASTGPVARPAARA